MACDYRREFPCTRCKNGQNILAVTGTRNENRAEVIPFKSTPCVDITQQVPGFLFDERIHRWGFVICPENCKICLDKESCTPGGCFAKTADGTDDVIETIKEGKVVCSPCNSQGGTYTANGGCFACLPNCNSCTGPASCDSCEGSYVLKFGTNNQCVACDQPNEFKKDGFCHICTDPNCVKCDSENECLECKVEDGFAVDTVNRAKCISGCNLLDGRLEVNGRCVQCIKGCKDCENLNECKKCSKAYSITTGTNLCEECGINDPKRFVDDQGKCQTCGQGCLSCESANKCKKCDTGLQLVNGSRCEPCPPGSYVEPVTGLCLPCKTSSKLCFTCLAEKPDRCQQCYPNAEMVDGECYYRSPFQKVEGRNVAEGMAVEVDFGLEINPNLSELVITSLVVKPGISDSDDQSSSSSATTESTSQNQGSEAPQTGEDALVVTAVTLLDPPTGIKIQFEQPKKSFIKSTAIVKIQNPNYINHTKDQTFYYLDSNPIEIKPFTKLAGSEKQIAAVSGVASNAMTFVTVLTFLVSLKISFIIVTF